MKNVQISLPDDLARDAADAGLLDSAILQTLLRDCLSQRQAAQIADSVRVQSFASVSTPSFANIWNNPEDDIYDAL